jgi:hypothetical protein
VLQINIIVAIISALLGVGWHRAVWRGHFK